MKKTFADFLKIPIEIYNNGPSDLFREQVYALSDVILNYEETNPCYTQFLDKVVESIRTLLKSLDGNLSPEMYRDHVCTLMRLTFNLGLMPQDENEELRMAVATKTSRLIEDSYELVDPRKEDRDTRLEVDMMEIVMEYLNAQRIDRLPENAPVLDMKHQERFMYLLAHWMEEYVPESGWNDCDIIVALKRVLMLLRFTSHKGNRTNHAFEKSIFYFYYKRITNNLDNFIEASKLAYQICVHLQYEDMDCYPENYTKYWMRQR